MGRESLVNEHSCKLKSRFRHENMVTMGRCTTGTQGIRSTRTAFAKNLLASALALSPENDHHISSYSAIDTSTVSFFSNTAQTVSKLKF